MIYDTQFAQREPMKLPIHISSLIWEAKKHNDNKTRRRLGFVADKLRLLPILTLVSLMVSKAAAAIQSLIKKLSTKVQGLAPMPYRFMGQIQNINGYQIASDEEILKFRAIVGKQEQHDREQEELKKQRTIDTLVSSLSRRNIDNVDIPTVCKLGSSATLEGAKPLEEWRPTIPVKEMGTHQPVEPLPEHKEAFPHIITAARSLVTFYDSKNPAEESLAKSTTKKTKAKKAAKKGKGK